MERSTASDVRRLWERYARTRSDKDRNRLMEHYLPLVRRIAQHIHSKLPREVELDDLVSAGVFGLMYAITAFNPGRKVKFETYCGNRIRGAILDELRSWDWVPRLARRRHHQLRETKRNLEMELGRAPSDEELADRLHVSPRELRKIMGEGDLVRVLPLGSPPGDGPGESPLEQCFAQATGPEEFTASAREDARRLIRELSRAERLIVLLYYAEQMTMKEIGRTLDLSESRVSQMHSAIIARLRARLLGRAPHATAA